MDDSSIDCVDVKYALKETNNKCCSFVAVYYNVPVVHLTVDGDDLILMCQYFNLYR